MSSSHQVRSTTASLLLGIAALVVVLPSAALWGTPSPSLFSAADHLTAALSDDPSSGSALSATHLDVADAPALRTEPWQSPIPLLFLLAVVVGLWSAAPVRCSGTPT